MRTDILNPGGVTTTVALEDGALISGTTQDCTPIADWCKSRHNEGFTGPSSDMKLAASIPFVMVEKYLNDNHLTMRELAQDQAHIKRLISDPALAHFRVWNGRL